MAKVALLFLHGSGSSGMELRGFLESCRLPALNLRTFRQVLEQIGVDLFTPTAPTRSYSPAGGEEMNVWFDRSRNFIQEGLNSKEDSLGTDKSLAFISNFMKEKCSDYDHIILGGFSMGGGLALHALRSPPSPKLAAVFAMGSFLVSSSEVYNCTSLGKLPVLMMHGADDSMINVSWGRDTATNLHFHGVEMEFREYRDTDHEIGEEEVVISGNKVQLLSIVIF